MMTNEINLDNITHITLYTGNDNFCICKCPNCPIGMSLSKKDRHKYQGTDEQMDLILNNFPNLKELYMLGNPDTAKDPKFCNTLARKSIKKLKCQVSFCTSGVGGKKTMVTLLNKISPKDVLKVVFSFDSCKKETMDKLKGINYPMESAVAGLRLCLTNGYDVRVQPTLWHENYKDLKETLEYFYSLGVRSFSCHVGSIETNSILHHLTKEELLEVNEVLQKFARTHADVDSKVPVIFQECGENDDTKYFCKKGKNPAKLICQFREDGFWCTPTPIAAETDEKYKFNLIDGIKKYNVPCILPKDAKNICPLSKLLSGYPNTYCRYVSRAYKSR